MNIPGVNQPQERRRRVHSAQDVPYTGISEDNIDEKRRAEIPFHDSHVLEKINFLESRCESVLAVEERLQEMPHETIVLADRGPL